MVDGEYVQAIKKSELQKIAKAFKRNGGVIRQDEEAKTILAFKGVQAITFNAKTILLTEAPTRATVFEELIHTRQYREGRIESSARSRIVCEIEAKEKLLKYASAYRLTKAKIRETQKLLAADKRELVKLNGE